MLFDNVFIINLQRDISRRENMIMQLKQHNICDYEFIEAIDGQSENLDKYDFTVIPNWVEPFTNKIMTKGEIGCALTHYNIWKKMVNEKLENVLILEDDAVFCNNFLEMLHNIEYNVKKLKYDLLYLGRNPLNVSNEEKINDNIAKVRYSYGTHAYILSLEGAIKLCSTNYLHNLFPVDEFISFVYDANYPYQTFKDRFMNMPQFNAYSVDPLLIHVLTGDQYKSTTYFSEPYFKKNKDSYIILTVATDYNDAVKRFEESCKIYGHQYKILGLGETWNGGEMSISTGGGQKINLLKKELLAWSKEELQETIVLFSDSYDVIINANKYEILNKYAKIIGINTNMIVFSSEKYCWPSKELSEKYPKVPYANKYLNSGGFIGNAYDILKIMDTDIYNWDDDQLYFTLKFLNNCNIMLDYHCEIFQTLNNSIQDISIEFHESRVCNKVFNTKPCVIHGNGSQYNKIALNGIGNYLGNGYNTSYKFCINNALNYTPKIYINYVDYQERPLLSEILNYPEDKYVIKNEDFGNIVKDFLNTDCEYLFVIEKKCHITNKNTLNELLNINKSVVAPMFKRIDNKYWSNFWGELDDNGFYKRSFDYLDIINYQRKAIWNVPYVSGIYLIKREVFEKMPNVYIDNPQVDIDMRFCNNLRKINTFMYVTNMDIYGYISDFVYGNIIPNNNVTIFDIDHDKWETTYIHPEYINNVNNFHTICSEPCKDLYYFPLFTEQFCREIIVYCNGLNKWSPGNNDEMDERLGGYENVPTQDIHLKQINFDTQWKKIVFKYIAPLSGKLYNYLTKDINISFVVKYSMNGQKELVPHHDASTYTLNVCLNNSFEGGGCRFIRQDYILNNKKIGYSSIHPGRLTHYHEGLSISEGERYVLISFIN